MQYFEFLHINTNAIIIILELYFEGHSTEEIQFNLGLVGHRFTDKDVNEIIDYYLMSVNEYHV